MNLSANNMNKINIGSIVTIQAVICIVILLVLAVVDDAKLNSAYPIVGILGNQINVLL